MTKSMQTPVPAHRGSSGRCPGALRSLPGPVALVDWLPPAEMTGEIHEFDARVWADIRCRCSTRRTSPLSAARRPIGCARTCPPRLRAEDNEAGSRLSLEQLVRRFE
jgi:hypothetical protein